MKWQILPNDSGSIGMLKCQIWDWNQRSRSEEALSKIFHTFLSLVGNFTNQKLKSWLLLFTPNKKVSCISHENTKVTSPFTRISWKTQKISFHPFIQSAKVALFFHVCATHMQFVTQHLAFYGVTLSVTTVTLNEGV